MDTKELREKTEKELQDQLIALRREQFNLRVQRATGQQARPDQFSRVRRDIARLKTVLREREIRSAKA
jgi:large subunit ribosomal protein L29